MKQRSLEQKTIMVVAGESSGDILAAGLISELQQGFPNARFIGVAGENMLALGVESVFPLDELNVMGFIEVLPHLKRLFNKRDQLIDIVESAKVDLLVTIDFQDFNASLAKKVKARFNIPCVHYVSPTVWAWRRGRIYKMAKYLDHLLALFPFEPEMYYGSGLACSFIGHPLALQMKGMSALSLSYQNSQKNNTNSKEGEVILALLPGSRGGLIKKLLPTMLAAYKRLRADNKVNRLCLPIAHEEHERLIVKIATEMDITAEELLFVNHENRFDALAKCRAALVASGTSNLELAMLGIPMLVVYRLNFLSYYLLKPFIDVPYISPVNWVAGKNVLPELVQYECNQEKIVEQLSPLLNDSVQRSHQIAELRTVRESLGETQNLDASSKAAEIVAKYLI